MKRHANVLYVAVVMLLFLQILSFVSFSSLTSKMLSSQENLEMELKITKQENQYNINEIAKIVSKQKRDVDEQIKLLKNEEGDFSEIIESSIKKVVNLKTTHSAGAGFFIDSRGYIVANQHILNGNSRIEVQTYDGRTFDAEIIGEDIETDLLLLKIPGVYDKLELANSDEIEVGEKVIAIGNPLGLSFTVTEGIVSGVEREGMNGLNIYVQTDVTLNPGNSGGPLINENGKVIGINNFKVNDAESLGFALESNVVKEKINLIANEELIK